jgi:hypothetical protein
MSTETLSVVANQGMSLSQDIEIPRLNVIQKMSQIEGPVGSVVLDKEFVLLEAEQKTPVIIVGAVKRWKEDVPYDDDQIPKMASTEAEARALAQESSYPMVEFAEIVLLIPQIGDDDTNFPYPIGDTNYQLGRLTVQKDAYRLTFKRLFTFQTFNPTVPAFTRLWTFGTELMTKGKYSWYVPTLSVTKEESPKAAQEFASRPNA